MREQILKPIVLAAMLIGVIATLSLTVRAADSDSGSDSTPVSESIAIFAGGCFWCVESDFDAVPGVIETVSGYSGGTTKKPTYKNHHAGMHREVVQITFDASKVSYEQLLHTFWRSVDPTDDGGQFCDRGHSYTTAIYAVDQAQAEAAEQSKSQLIESGALRQDIVTPIEPAAEFWPAEDYHQNYYQKNPIRYKYYRNACGRDKRVNKVWGAEARAGIEAH